MTRAVAVIVVALLAISSAALADGHASADTEEPPRPEPAKRGRTKKPKVVRPDAAAMEKVGGPKARLTLPGGGFMLTIAAEVNMAKGAVGKPLSVAPDLWIGAADRLTVGILHSQRAATGFLTGSGSGLCFRGNGLCDGGLGNVYTFVAGEARIGLSEGGFALAFVAGAQARQFDPDLVLSGKAGFIARMGSASRIALELAPAVYIGITQRKIMNVDYNVDLFGAPATVYLRLAGGFALALQAGVTFVLKDAGNTWRIPAAAGISWWLSPHVSFDAAFGLAAVADSDDATKAFDNRSVTVGLGYAH